MVLLVVVSRFLPSEPHCITVFRSALYYLLFFAFGFLGAAYITKYYLVVCWLSVIVVFLVGLLLGEKDGNSLSLKGMAYITSGVCGAYAVIQAGKIRTFPNLEFVLTKAGRNTITIYGTHHIIYAIMGILLGISDFKSTPIGLGLIIFLSVVLLEIPVIYGINRWVPWLAG